jgi:S-DNA-T family DNA segregation ATPase FtsK/SpoIIIE
VHRIPAPRPPDAPAPYRFPIVATIAPVIAAVVIWVLTASPFALVFAALGPVTAVASLLDARIGSRRTRRREFARFLAEAERVRAGIRSWHDDERADLAELAPAARELASRTGADPRRWTGDARHPLLVAAGVGAVPSRCELESGPPHEDARVAEAVAELAGRAAVLRGAPVLVDARLGVGLVGPPLLAAAAARALVVAIAWALSPAEHWCRGRDPWMLELPHPAGPAPGLPGAVAEFGRRGESEPIVTVATADSEGALPGQCRVVVVLGPGGAGVVRHPERGERRELRPELLSVEAAAAWGRRATVDAARDGLVADGSDLPSAVQLASLLRDGSDDPRSLACEFAVGTAGAVTVDLVADGPHAIVGGTTGSGKSELLGSWVLAMATAYPPERFTVLLVDFKGGAAFAALAELPHTVGIVTDLDEAGAARALASLRAELRLRERSLAEAAARDVAEVPSLARLVIVVDEFAAVMTDHPDLHALFADIAARGRSLGVHLVLCTQRPSGVVRDAVLANADLRISLRVNNRADSAAVVGSDAAASLPASARGRGVLSAAGTEPRPVQFALAGPTDIALAVERWADSPPVRRPWREPLPALVTAEDLATPGFGLLDLPEEQRRAVARYEPAADGHLLVLGTSGSGKSTALAAIGGEWLPGDPAAAWDALADLGSARERVVLLDDADSLFARFPAEYRQAFAERLAAVLRDGPRRGIRLVLGAQRMTAELQSLAGLVPARLYLRHASRQEFVLAGGEGAAYLDGLPPGGGLWRGHRVQVALTTVPDHEVPPRVAELDSRPLAIVTTRVASVLAALPGSVPLSADPVKGAPVVGEAEEWQSRWGALAAVRPVAQVVFDGCSVADFRALTRSRELPPPLEGHPDLAWRLESDGTASRVRFPL